GLGDVAPEPADAEDDEREGDGEGEDPGPQRPAAERPQADEREPAAAGEDADREEREQRDQEAGDVEPPPAHVAGDDLAVADHRRDQGRLRTVVAARLAAPERAAAAILERRGRPVADRRDLDP